MMTSFYKIIIINLKKIVASFRLRRDFFLYKIRLPRLRVQIFSKEIIRIVFFPINIGMWKNDYLFKFLMEHPRFDPYIVSFFVPSDTPDYQRRNQEEMSRYFREKGYPYFDMYDYEKQEWFDIQSFHPDIVFYTQAVDVAYPQYRIKSLWKKTLFYYIPYCMGMENIIKGYNTLLDNISLCFFAPSNYHVNEYSSFFLNKGRNIKCTGYPSFDYLIRPQHNPHFEWKYNDNRKRVIWAPHHSILQEDILNYSNFLSIADDMIELAINYKDSVEFVFKPHPRLRPKLETLDGWGYERTATYYEAWDTMPNTKFIDGEYYDLFLTSDAMIHDCSTFMAEYLLTGKPVLFVLKDQSAMNLNEYAQHCFEEHYIGHTIAEIDSFIKNVVLEGNDPMKESRITFREDFLLPKGNRSVAKNIYDVIVSELR